MKTLKQLITESVNEYLREIEEAGNENAVIEKMKSCEEAIAVRERKIKMDGIEEAMHDMIDPKKIKELQKEVKVIEKTLKKYQKQLEKLKSKNKHVGAEDTEDSTEEPEEIIDEGMEEDVNEYGLEHDPNQIRDKDKDGDIDVEDSLVNEVLTPEEEEELDRIEDEIRYKANSNSVSFNSKMKERYEELKAKQNQMPAPPEELNIDINESFLYMQKLAGLITEGQYQAKKKVLNRKKSIAEGMDENLVVTYIKNKADYPEKGLADGFHEYEGKTVKYIVGYDENDEYDEIGYIYAKNNDIKSYSDDELDNAFMISLAEGQYQAKKKVLNRKKSIAEGVDEKDFDALMDAVDEYYEPNTPEHKKLSNAVEKALDNGEIDTMDFSDSPSSPYNTVARIAKEMEKMDKSLNESFLYRAKLKK
jgi:hypothetical protein